MRAAGWAMVGALALASVEARAQEAPSWRRFTVTWHPLALFFNSWQFEFEAALTRALTLHANPSMVFTVDGGVPRPYAFAMDVGAKLYPFGRAPSGFFVGAHVGMSDWDIAAFSQNEHGLGVRGGLSTGFALVWRRFVLSSGGGVEVIYFRRPQFSEERVRVYPFTRVGLGVNF